MNVQNTARLPWLMPVLYGSLAAISFVLLLAGGASHNFFGKFLVTVCGGAVVVAVMEIFWDAFRRPNTTAGPYRGIVSDEHLQLRDQIIASLERAKSGMQPVTAKGYVDGYAMYFTETPSVIWCSLQIDADTRLDTDTSYKYSYDMERKYCIRKSGSYAVRTICDAHVTRVTAEGTIIQESWRQPDDTDEWAMSLEHIASESELKELSDYLKQLTEHA
jgi:hypothetical protein